MLRYLKKLEDADIALNRSMIALGSCTMKLNAVAEMIPVTWREFSEPHPFAPVEQMEGYRTLFTDLKNWLRSITVFSGVSLQPNAGAQGEFAGLMHDKTMRDPFENYLGVPQIASPEARKQNNMRIF